MVSKTTGSLFSLSTFFLLFSYLFPTLENLTRDSRTNVQRVRGVSGPRQGQIFRKIKSTVTQPHNFHHIIWATNPWRYTAVSHVYTSISATRGFVLFSLTPKCNIFLSKNQKMACYSHLYVLNDEDASWPFRYTTSQLTHYNWSKAVCRVMHAILFIVLSMIDAPFRIRLGIFVRVFSVRHSNWIQKRMTFISNRHTTKADRRVCVASCVLFVSSSSINY